VPLRTGANVAKFATEVKAAADQHRQAVDQLCAGLRQHLQRLGIDIQSAARLQTAQAALALVRGIAGSSKDDVVSVLASAHVATTAAAMGESLKKAEEMSAALENASWELFETIAQLPRERAPQAQSIVERVKDALMRDEHVIELKRALKEAQSAALELLTSLVDTTPPQPPAVQPPVVAPLPSRAAMTGDQRGIDTRRATTVFASIQKAMESDAALVLDIQWHLYRKGGPAR
jgi:hypothetical protein